MIRGLALGLLLIALAHALDPLAYTYIRLPEGAPERDWRRLLRVMGFLPTWIAIAAALALQERSRRPGWLVLAAGLAGLAAEVAKLLIRRERPGEAGYSFRAFGEDPLSTAHLGLPSSHVAVAFGGAWMIARLYPRAAPAALALAAGCALTRLLEGDHWLSDVVAAGVLAWAVASLLRPGDTPREPTLGE